MRRMNETRYAGVAQLVEQLICNQQVGGSSPSTSSTISASKYGRFPEWPKGADCKSVVNDFGGSNPPPPTKRQSIERCSVFVLGAGQKSSCQGKSEKPCQLIPALSVAARHLSQRERQVWIARKIKNPSGAFSGGIHLSMRNYFTISFAAAAYFSIFASTSAFSLPFAMM